MTQLTEDEQVFKRVEEKVKRAIFDYGLIQTGDRVLIGLSGGKDSLALVELLGRRSKIFNPRFEVVVAHVIMRNIPYHSDLDYLRQQVEACLLSWRRRRLIPLPIDENHPAFFALGCAERPFSRLLNGKGVVSWR